jgi:hypothetical protein
MLMRPDRLKFRCRDFNSKIEFTDVTDIDDPNSSFSPPS